MYSLIRVSLPLAALFALLLLGCGEGTEGNGSNGNGSCTPKTCSELGLDCGDHDDTCGGTISCGECVEGYSCEEGLCEEICVPQNCEDLGVRCGEHDDVCGTLIDCGLCGDCPNEPLCITPESGAPDTAVAVQPGPSPTLNGGQIEDGWLELENLLFYTDDFLSSSFATSVSVTSNGNTYGSLEFWGEEWGLEARLDLHIDIQTSMMGPINQDFAVGLNSGGCFTITANRIVGDLLQCGGSWVEGSNPPDGVDYEVGGGEVHILVIIPRQVFIDSMPADYQQWADIIVVGDLPILMRFEE